MGEFVQFFGIVYQCFYEVLKFGGVLFLCMDWCFIVSLVEVGEYVGFEFINMVVWDKMIGGMGLFYWLQYELICVFWNVGVLYCNNV